MKLETHASCLAHNILNAWNKVIYDLTKDSYPAFNVYVKGIRILMSNGDVKRLMDLNILEDCSLIIDTDDNQHEIIIRDTLEKL